MYFRDARLFYYIISTVKVAFNQSLKYKKTLPICEGLLEISSDGL